MRGARTSIARVVIAAGAQSIEMNDPTRALQLYDRLVRESVDGRYAVEAQLARAHLLRQVGRPDEALRVCEAAVGFAGRCPSARTARSHPASARRIKQGKSPMRKVIFCFLCAGLYRLLPSGC